MESLRIIGMTSERYVQTYLDGHNCHFERKTQPATRYYLFAENINTGDYCRIMLDEDYTRECYSGWTTASFGILEKEPVTVIPQLSHVPIHETILEIDCTCDDFECDLFTYTKTGGDDYYPSGSVLIKFNKFQQVPMNN